MYTFFRATIKGNKVTIFSNTNLFSTRSLVKLSLSFQHGEPSAPLPVAPLLLVGWKEPPPKSLPKYCEARLSYHILATLTKITCYFYVLQCQGILSAVNLNSALTVAPLQLVRGQSQGLDKYCERRLPYSILTIL